MPNDPQILETLLHLSSEMGELRSDVAALVKGASDKEVRIRKLEAVSYRKQGVIGVLALFFGALLSWIGTHIGK